MLQEQDKHYQHIDRWQAQQEKKLMKSIEKRLRPPSHASIDRAMVAIKRRADKERQRITKTTP